MHLFKADIFLGLRQKVLWIIKFKWLSDIWGGDKVEREEILYSRYHRAACHLHGAEGWGEIGVVGGPARYWSGCAF